MQNGDLCPNNLILSLIKQLMLKAGSTKYILDGFPREIEQALLFEQDIYPCTFVLNFDCPDEILKQRCLDRGKISGRLDDNEKSISKV